LIVNIYNHRPNNKSPAIT